MIDNNILVPVERVERTILLVRGQKVILDADLAKLYGVTTKRLNQQVKRNRGFDKKYYQDMILALIREHGSVKRQDIDELILPKLPEVLSQKQKKAKIHNLLTELSIKMKKIKNIGSRKLPQWVLLKNNEI